MGEILTLGIMASEVGWLWLLTRHRWCWGRRGAFVGPAPSLCNLFYRLAGLELCSTCAWSAFARLYISRRRREADHHRRTRVRAPDSWKVGTRRQPRNFGATNGRRCNVTSRHGYVLSMTWRPSPLAFLGRSLLPTALIKLVTLLSTSKNNLCTLLGIAFA